MIKLFRRRLLGSTSTMALARQQRRAMRDSALQHLERQINGGPPVPPYVVAWVRMV